MGVVTKYFNPDVLYRLACFYYDRDTIDIMGEKNGKPLNMAEFLDWAEAEDPMVITPADYVMPGRVTLMLRGLANAFLIKLNMVDYFKKYGEDTVKALDPAYYEKVQQKCQNARTLVVQK